MVPYKIFQDERGLFTYQTELMYTVFYFSTTRLLTDLHLTMHLHVDRRANSTTHPSYSPTRF